MSESEKFKETVESSEEILVTSHISPDPDAVCSALLLGTALKLNFTDKNVEVVLEEHPSKDLSFLTGYDRILFQPLKQSLDSFKPDLLIIADANTYDRVSRKDSQSIRETAQKGTFKTVSIDHHQEVGRDQFDVFINNHSPATAEDVFHLLFEELKLQKPVGYAETTMLGIISDSNRFKYADSSYRRTFNLVSNLIDTGVSIEKLENRLESLTKGQATALAMLLNNTIDSGKGYSYSFVEDSQRQSVSDDDFKLAADIYTFQYLRNFEANRWGFIVYPELESGTNIYSVSFRSVSDDPDVSKLAAKLGGGGHKSAAGAKFEAANIEEAIEKVKQVMHSTIISS